jgi:hypothetical protein
VNYAVQPRQDFNLPRRRRRALAEDPLQRPDLQNLIESGLKTPS